VARNEGLAFGVLGPLQMRVAGTEVLLGTPKQRAVLAMLAIIRNRPVGIESLLGAAWGSALRPVRGRAGAPTCRVCADSSVAEGSMRVPRW
jgi:hypothetical protein